MNRSNNRRVTTIVGFVLLLAGLLFTGCVVDDSNYDYVDPGTVDFYGMLEDTVVLVGEPLYIEPTFTANANEEDLTYTWYTYLNDTNDQRIADTLSTQKILDIINTLPVGVVELHFNVYNEALDVNYQHTIEVNVSTAFSQGWGILRDVGGSAEYDFISFVTGTHITDLLAAFVEEGLSGTPLSLDYYNFYGFTGSTQTLVILCEEDYIVLDNADLSVHAHGLENNFQTTDNMTLPVQGGNLGQTAWDGAATGYIQIGGQLHAKAINRSYPEAAPTFSGIPVPGDYQASANYSGDVFYFNYYVFFDELNKRYLYIEGGEAQEFVAEAFVEPADVSEYDPNDLSGMDCLWLSTTTGAAYGVSGIGNPVTGNAVLTDADGNYFLQKIEITLGPSFDPVYQVTVPDGYVNENSIWVNNAQGTYTYFTNSGTIGRFVDGESPSDANFDPNYITDYAGENIIDIQIFPDGSTMLLAIENGADSEVIFYDLQTETESESYAVEGKVVDMRYQEF